MKLVRVDDEDVSATDLAVYETVLRIAGRHGVDHSGSLEAEAFFVDLLARYTGPADRLAEWLDTRLKAQFMSLGGPPRWLQGAQWPFAGGVPMRFVGQLDVGPEDGTASFPVSRRTSGYVFDAPGAPPTVIRQED